MGYHHVAGDVCAFFTEITFLRYCFLGVVKGKGKAEERLKGSNRGTKPKHFSVQSTADHINIGLFLLVCLSLCHAHSLFMGRGMG